MNDVWKRMMKDWLACSESIDRLEKEGLLKEEEPDDMRNRLLITILETFKSEVAD